jgi:hypothetical protein
MDDLSDITFLNVWNMLQNIYIVSEPGHLQKILMLTINPCHFQSAALSFYKYNAELKVDEIQEYV